MSNKVLDHLTHLRLEWCMGQTPIMDATIGGAVPGIVNAHAPHPHRQPNPFRAIPDSDVANCPDPNALNIYFREAMACIPAERLNDDWSKHFHSIGVCSLGLEYLRDKSPDFDYWIRKQDGALSLPYHIKTNAYRPNHRPHRHS